MATCPRCDVDVKEGGNCYRCGWQDKQQKTSGKKTYTDYETFPCQVGTCRMPTHVSLIIAGQRINHCEFHYREHFRSKAAENCAERGLLTPAQKRAWVMDQVSKLARRLRPPYSREPGQDDEERAVSYATRKE